MGDSGKTSIRAGFGIFYAAIQGETLGLISDNAPYGFTYTSPAPSLFSTPFVDAATGNVEGQRFPAQLAPLNVSRSNPDANIDFSQFEPIGAIPGYKSTNTIPYTESYTLSLQRQIGNNTLKQNAGQDGFNRWTINGVAFAENEMRPIIALKPGAAVPAAHAQRERRYSSGPPSSP